MEHSRYEKISFFKWCSLLLGIGCQKNNTQVSDRIAKLEQRVEALEKRPAAAAISLLNKLNKLQHTIYRLAKAL